jgi:hypothetical protein
MPADLLYPDDIDARFNWHPGRTVRLARKRILPHYVLPDGSIRLKWEEVSAAVVHVPASVASSGEEAQCRS